MRPMTVVFACGVCTLLAVPSTANSSNLNSRYNAPWNRLLSTSAGPHLSVWRDAKEPYEVTVRMSKSGASLAAFQYDRKVCLTANKNRGNWSGAAPLDTVAFLHCMKDKGYRADSNGYEAVSFRPVVATEHQVIEELTTP